jgi:serine protease inhibitor
MKILPLFLLLFLLIGCNKTEKDISINPPVNIDKITDFTATMNDFAWNLLATEMETKPNENVLLSPYSVHTALSMALNGAEGMTKQEMLKVLHCNGCDEKIINRYHQELLQKLSHESGHPELNVANAFFYDSNRVTVKESFREVLEMMYECGFIDEDFDNEENAKMVINDWVKNQTKGKIDGIVESISQEHIAFLINTLHFKADWSKPFDEESTQQKNFIQADGESVMIDFIFGIRSLYAAESGAEFMVDLPFQDSTYSLSLIGSSNSPAFTRGFSADQYREMLGKLTYQDRTVSFPTMKLEYKNTLMESLVRMGMPTAFDPDKANFESLGAAAQNIYVNDIMHKTILEVDEKGAEGAAVTSIEFGISELPLFTEFNRSFLLVLRHIPTEAIVFLGVVNEDPS